MKTYESMKSSSVFWLGMIPEHWEERFLEQTCHEKCIKNIGNTESNVLSLSYGYIIKKKNVYSGLVAKDFSTYQIVQNGDIILRFTDLQNDHKSLRTGLVTQTGIITSAYTCIVPTVNSAYLHYLLHANDLRKVFYGMGGGVRQSIGYKDVRHMTVLVPPRFEQDQIVRFLDWKVSEINRLINIKWKEIERLEELKKAVINKAVTKGLDDNVELKDSGISWLGKIPEHWGCKKISSLFSERRTKVSDKDYAPLSVAKIGVVPQLETAVKTDAGDNRKLVCTGDFVINSRSDRKGSCGISELDGSVSLINIVLTPRSEWNNQYAHYLLRSQTFSEEYYRYGRGIVADLWTTRFSEMKNIMLPVPPRSEQDKIANYIDQICEKYNNAIKILTDQIEKLHELKIRLISDVVTGKIDIRDIEVPEFKYVEEIEDDFDSDKELEEKSGDNTEDI